MWVVVGTKACFSLDCLFLAHTYRYTRPIQSTMAILKPVRSNASQARYDPRKPSVTSIMPDGDVPNFDGLTEDEKALTALGYKQEFKREFSLWTSFCVSFAVLGLLPSFASTLYYGMGYAGTGGMVWGWLISWVFIQCVAMGMAELCSSMPTRCVSLLSRLCTF